MKPIKLIVVRSQDEKRRRLRERVAGEVEILSQTENPAGMRASEIRFDCEIDKEQAIEWVARLIPGGKAFDHQGRQLWGPGCEVQP